MFGQFDPSYMFAEQFEPDEASYRYRKNSKDAPILVSAEERDQFIQVYDKNRIIMIRAIALLLMAVVMLVVSLEVSVDRSNFTTWLAVVAMLIIFFWHRWLWNAPARALQGRPTIGEARSNAELRQMALVKLSYGQIAFVVVFSVFLLSNLEWKHGWRSIWNASILAVVAATLVALAIQVFRKWRLESPKQ
jgi:hypothetical protein